MPSPLVGFIWGCIMLQKIKNSYFFSNRFFSLCLVFFVSFSIFSFGFGSKKTKANPLVPILENELAPVIISVLGTLGVTVSLPTAHDFVQQELDKSSQLSKQMAEGTLPIQQLRDKGFYVSKQFVENLCNDWKKYLTITPVYTDIPVTAYYRTFSKNTFTSPPYTFTFPANTKLTIGYYFCHRLHTNDVYTKTGTVILEYSRIGKYYLTAYDGSVEADKALCTFDAFDKDSGYYFFVDTYNNYHGFDTPVTEVKKKSIDSVKPLSDKQGIFLPMPVVNNVSKAIDSPTPVGVGNTQTGTLSPPIDLPVGGSVPTDVPSIVGGASIGAIPWGNDGTVPIPNDKPIDKPVDGSDSKPVDGADSKPVDKPIGGIGENIWDKILEFLKKILIPSDNFFIDEFKALEGELNGKFDGNGLNYISDFKNNSKSVDPKFVYTFTVMGTTVTLDFSFVTRIVPLCHIVFGGLTLLFLAWYHYKNVLLLIRGISPVEGGNFTGNSSGGGIDFKAMGDSAPSSPVSTISTSKGNSNYSTTNKYSGGAK